MLMLLVKVSDVAAEEFKIKQERNMSGNAVFPYQYKFATNKLVNLIREDNELSKLVARRRVRLDDDFIRTAYRVLKSHAPYQSYAEAISSDFQTDKLICEEIVKEVFFKHEVIFQVYEEENINWEENRSSLRSMVLKTIKNLEENQTIVLLDLSKNWTDDRNFFIDCYTNTLENENVYEKYISSHLKNWDLERVALVDKVILEMALSEMFNCPSIPIKVTINEYVELAKNYSTPKSKEFVNGILDVLSKELTEKGIIRKSGRGLLDNQ
jgi:N utilization substance protein B